MSEIEAVVRFDGIGEYWRSELTEEEITRGWTIMPCPDCAHAGSNGIFVQPDGSWHHCISCSGSGEVMVSLPPTPTRGPLTELGNRD